MRSVVQLLLVLALSLKWH